MKKRVLGLALMVIALVAVLCIGVGAESVSGGVLLRSGVTDGMIVETADYEFKFNMSAVFATDVATTKYYYKTEENAEWMDGTSTYTYDFGSGNYGDQTLWFKCEESENGEMYSSEEFGLILRYYQGGETPTLTSGYYEIYSYQQLVAVSDEESAVSIKLMDDIDIYTTKLTNDDDIATPGYFSESVLSFLNGIAELDGNDYTITYTEAEDSTLSILKLNNSEAYVHDVTFDCNNNINGIWVNYYSATFEDVTVIDAISDGYGLRIGNDFGSATIYIKDDVSVGAITSDNGYIYNETQGDITITLNDEDVTIPYVAYDFTLRGEYCIVGNYETLYEAITAVNNGLDYCYLSYEGTDNLSPSTVPLTGETYIDTDITFACGDGEYGITVADGGYLDILSPNALSVNGEGITVKVEDGGYLGIYFYPTVDSIYAEYGSTVYVYGYCHWDYGNLYPIISDLTLEPGATFENGTYSTGQSYTISVQDGDGTLTSITVAAGEIYTAHAVAEIDGVYYLTLASAIADTEDGDTVTILSDVTLEDNITISTDITITAAEDVTVTTGGGETAYTGHGDDASNFIVDAGKTVTFEGVTFDVDGYEGASIAIYAMEGSDITVNNCVFNAMVTNTETTTYAMSAVRSYEETDKDYAEYSLTFTNNTVDGDFRKALLIYLGENDTLTVTGNTFTASTGTTALGVGGYSDASGMAVAVEDDSAVVIITGNTFDTYKKVISVDGSSETGKWTITGNSFTNVGYAFDLSTADGKLSVNTGYSLAYNYFELDGVVGYVKVLDSNKNAEYVYANNDSLSKLVFYPYYADAELTTLVYETGEVDVEDAVEEALSDALADGASDEDIAAAIEILTAVDTDYIAKDSSLLSALNELDAALVESNTKLDVSTNITKIDDGDVVATAEGVSVSELIAPDDDDKYCAEAQGLAVAIIGNEDISSYTSVTVGLTINQTAASATDVTDEETEETTTTIVVTYDITPFVSYNNGGETTVSNAEITNPVTFKLYLPSIFSDTNRAYISHDGGDDVLYTVYNDGNPYAILTVTHFSEFEVTYATKVTSSGSTNVGTIIYPDGEETEDDEEVETEVDTDDDSFKDVDSDDYFYDAVEWAVENGITSGMTSTTFVPDGDCTRVQAVTFLWRAMGSPEMDVESVFYDVDGDDYYADAVAWAIEDGVTLGTNDTTFDPDLTCTRGQIVTFLYRLAGEPEMAGDCDFTDVDSEAYYYSAVLWAVENGITDGMGDGTFAPDDNCTRAQIVTFLYRYFN